MQKLEIVQCFALRVLRGTTLLKTLLLLSVQLKQISLNNSVVGLVAFLGAVWAFLFGLVFLKAGGVSQLNTVLLKSYNVEGKT